MFDNSVHAGQARGAEAVLRADVARADSVAEAVHPMLRHLLAAEDRGPFSDEIIARVRGSLEDLARHLIEASIAACPSVEPLCQTDSLRDALARALRENRALLTHVHAMALEWQVTQALQTRLSLDPVVPPLVQAMVASPNPGMQERAMAWLAAQARWCQAQRKMQLTPGELPGELLEGALLALRVTASSDPLVAEAFAMGERQIRARHDEAKGRRALAISLVSNLAAHGDTALALDHAGVALFVAGLSLATGQTHEAVVLALQEVQASRFVLALRAAGVSPGEVGRQALVLHPDYPLPDGFEAIGADLAAAILAAGRGSP